MVPVAGSLDARAPPPLMRRELDDRLRERVAHELGVSVSRLSGLDAQMIWLVSNRLEELKAAAAVDEMTGALRRAAGLAALEREVRRARRFNDDKLVVVFVDVDDLKAVNDTLGHAAGDAVLREVAAALRKRLRAYDLVIRWGGDEFVCSLPQAGLEAAGRALDDVRTELAARTHCRFTAGLAELGPGDATGEPAEGTAEELVARADADYYERMRRERCGLARQKRQGSLLHSPAYSTPIRAVRTTSPGAGRKPSSTT
jgi:diguanylate cyclase (GGDEF)-like protein